VKILPAMHARNSGGRPIKILPGQVAVSAVNPENREGENKGKMLKLSDAGISCQNKEGEAITGKKSASKAHHSVGIETKHRDKCTNGKNEEKGQKKPIQKWFREQVKIRPDG